MEHAFDRRAKHLRILLAVRRGGPLRFTDVQRRTGLASTEVQRHLQELCDHHFLHARPYGKKGRKLLIEYELSRKGKAHLYALDAYRAALERRAVVAGEETLRALQAIYA